MLCKPFNIYTTAEILANEIKKPLCIFIQLKVTKDHKDLHQVQKKSKSKGINCSECKRGNITSTDRQNYACFITKT